MLSVVMPMLATAVSDMVVRRKGVKTGGVGGDKGV